MCTIAATCNRVTYHICFFSEDAVIQALRRHPLDWELYCVVRITLSEIVLGVDVLRESKVRNFDDKMEVDPNTNNLCVWFNVTGIY